MTRLFRDPVFISHWWLEEYLKPGMVVVDATAGNGHDTLFLARKVGPEGKVFAFDIQSAALEATSQLLRQHNVADRVELIAAGHERLRDYVHQSIHAMVFNLGYLPGGDKTIITRPETTLQALKGGMELLVPGGFIVLTVYTGHPGGLEEWESLKEYILRLPRDQWDIVRLTFLNRSPSAPFNIGIQKIGEHAGGDVC